MSNGLVNMSETYRRTGELSRLTDMELVRKAGRAKRSVNIYRGCQDGSHEMASAYSGYDAIMEEAKRRGLVI